MLEIPFNSDPSQVFQTELGGRSLVFSAMYNDRSGVWVMGIADGTTKEPLADSIPIVLGQNLLEPYNLGIGAIAAFDFGNTGKDAGPDDLGERVKVWWLSPDELEGNDDG